MMLHTKSPRRSLLKLLALIPIVGVALALNARTVTDYVYDEPQKQVPVKKGVKKGTIKMGNQKIEVVEQQKKNDVQMEVQKESDKDFKATLTYDETPSGDVFDVVEEMPQFPGGAQELFSYLAKNIKYPKEAEEANKQGRVIITFVVNKDGAISDAKVVKSVDPLLDAEGLRVISNMPDWTPGKQSGKAVRVKYTVPITFRLDGKPKEAPTATGTFTPAPAEDVTTPSLMKPSLVVVDGQTSDDIDKVMKSLDPKTIETMTVLKDKAAIEQYGEKAKGGVIVITTKK